MASINKVILVGNLGHKPELRTFNNGDRTTSVSLATTDRRKAKDSDQWTDYVEWHKVEFKNRLADIVCKHLDKGAAMYVEGSIRTRKWTDKQTGQERYITYVHADTIQMLSSNQSNQRHSNDGDESGYDDYS